jgi:ketosteroid isomerase-like protein
MEVREMPAFPLQRRSHHAISTREIADRLSIRELVEAYARCADTRDADGQMSLFTEDTHFVMRNAKDDRPSQELHSRKALAPIFADLKKYDSTTHFIGQSAIHSLTAESATGETHCLAHLVSITGDETRLTVISVRYLDSFRKIDDTWFFAERIACVDWTAER